MTNEQITGARAALNDFPEMKVTMGQTVEGETITPYLAADVFQRGAPVLIRPTMSKDEVKSAVKSAMQTLRASVSG